MAVPRPGDQAGALHGTFTGLSGESFVLSSATSCTLLNQALSRDDAAWRRLVTLYEPLVRHWCRRAGVEAGDVPDVTQDVFLSVSGSLADFRTGEAGRFRKWMRGIVRHKAADHFRRRRGGPGAAGGTEAYDLLQSLPDHDDADSDETDELYWRALDLIRGHFEDRTWRAFWRSAVDGDPTDLVASELGMSAVAVRVAKSRVLARLREDLGELIS